MATFVFDLDGTICFDRASVAPALIGAISEISERHSVVIASARHPINIVGCIPESLCSRWDVVGANGAIAYARGKLVQAQKLAFDVASSIIFTLEELSCPYLAYGVNFVVFSSVPHALHGAVANDQDKGLRCGGHSDLGQLIKVLALPLGDDPRPLRHCQALYGVDVVPHSDGTFDIMHSGVDKVSGLLALGHALPVFAGFGNDANDVPLLKLSRHSVGIGNHPSIRPVASRLISEGPDCAGEIANLILQLGKQADGPAVPGTVTGNQEASA